MKTDNNAKSTNVEQPAFPAFSMDDVGDITGHSGGLTKREYFAAMAMQGILSSATWDEDGRFTVNGANTDLQFVANEAVSLADALLNELNN